MTNEISFYLNGKKVVVQNPPTDTLLIDYLRSPEIHLSGPKKPCGQGGCGGCTVILSHWNAAAGKEEHRAINSCLRPLISVDGMVVTTVEGTGSARRPNPEFLTHTQLASRGGRPAEAPISPLAQKAYKEAQAKREAVFETIAQAEDDAAAPKVLLRAAPPEHPSEVTQLGVNPVAYKLAMNNGTQCGYCTVGFVMNMSEFIGNNPNATKQEIEAIFDGNICRCTGYRSILTGMKTFASDWTAEDEADRMKCQGDDEVNSQLSAQDLVIPFPDGAKVSLSGGSGSDGGKTWIRPTSLEQLIKSVRKYREHRTFLLHGNTAYGIYKEEFLAADVLIDLRLVPELNAPASISRDAINFGAGTTYSELIALLGTALKDGATAPPDGRDAETTAWGAALLMARRTAGRIVRNAGSIGGNTMAVLKHIRAGEPFPSDLLTVLAATGAAITYLDPFESTRGVPKTASVEELVDAVRRKPELARRIILLSYRLPLGNPSDVAIAQKVALREVNSHSIVNAATLLRLDAAHAVQEARLVFGGIAPFPWRATATEKLLRDKPLTLDRIPELLATLAAEVKQALAHWAPRMAELPADGFTEEYRIGLATAFLYKAIVKTLQENGVVVPEKIASAGEATWGKWGVSSGQQFYETQDFKAPVSVPYIKYTAMEQASGQLHYTHEYDTPLNTVNGAMVQSRRALAQFVFTFPGGERPATTAELRAHLSEKFDAFIDLVTSEAFKNGAINLQGMGSDQPIFATDTVLYYGQSIALVGAKSQLDAEVIAEYVADHCIRYTPFHNDDPRWNEPILGIDDALKNGSIFPDWPSSAAFISHIWRITRPGSQLGWVAEKDPLDKTISQTPGLVDGNSCTIVAGTQLTGGQAHFYMETQAAIAKPVDGGRFIVYSSTQSPMTIHGTLASALGVQYNAVDVRVPPVGGGFGGKTEQTRFVAAAAAVAAKALKRPVRLALSREQDTAMIGKRHAYYAQYQIAVDNGDANPGQRGIIRGLSNKMWGDGGAFYDCSFIVSNCIITRADNAYRIGNFQAQIDVCRTNTAPSTAFRAFGDVQGKIMLENAIDDAAFAIGMRPEEVREKNLYDRGDVTPFGQALTYCYMKDVWAYLKKEAAYDSKLAEVRAFNNANKWKKRGLSMIPVKYGSGYNLTMLEQAGAIVSVYQGDGSIVIHQGGVEMGQGLMTVVKQVASYILNVPMALVSIEDPKTSVILNPTSTGASTGTTYSAEAVKRACMQLRSRLMEFGYELLKDNGNDWCVSQGIDFWNYGAAGWNTKSPTPGVMHPLIWQNLVSLAYQHRINLSASLVIPITGGEAPFPNLTYKTSEQQPVIPGITSIKGGPGEFDAFSGFTYSAACTVAEVDILTGETKIISADVMYDIGWSMNPAIDVGQVEGAFVQGLGYVLSEQLVFEPEGLDAGRLNTLNTWTYKPPAVTTIPLELNVHLFPRNLASNVPENPSDILSSKEVGEPPLVLAVTAFFAVKDAVRESRLERGLSGLFRMDAPATVQEVRRACDVDLERPESAP